jgi:hypothetical protein
MNIFPKNIVSTIIHFIYVQLFITTVSLPILMYWGLPTSLLTAIGNFIYAPALMLFLFLSSVIFFLELFYIPNGLFIWLLEHTTNVWLWCLSWEYKASLIGFGKPSIIFLIAMPLAAFLVVQNKYTCRIPRATLCLSIILFGSCLVLKVTKQPSMQTQHIPRAAGQITLIEHNEQIVLIDPGYIGNNSSAPSWVNYTLIPEITKLTGKLTIDHLIILQPNAMVFEAVASLCNKITVNHLYIPWWNNKIPYNAWKQFAQLRDAIQKNGTKLIRIYNKPICIMIGKDTTLNIKPQEKQLTYHEATYPVVHVSGAIGDNSIDVWSAKYKRMRAKKTRSPHSS